MTARHSAGIGGITLSLVLAAGLAHAASDSKTLTINAVVSARAKLTISPSTINFPDADPDVVNPISATENAVTVSSKIRSSSAGVSTLTCLADGDLVSGADAIGITNVTWTSTGAGYAAGAMDKTSAQPVGTFAGSGTHPGTFNYSLANSWSYNAGNYSGTVVYTLATP